MIYYKETYEELGDIYLYRYEFDKDLKKSKDGSFKPKYQIIGKCVPEYKQCTKPDIIVENGMVYRS